MLPKIAAIQMNSGQTVAANLAQVRAAIARIAAAGAALVVLPEMFPIMGAADTDKLAVCETWGAGPIQDFLATCAAQYKIWIIGGTLPLKIEAEPNKISAACLVYDSAGQNVARYDKIHLFDVDVDTQTYRESNTTRAGTTTVVVTTPVGKVGLAVCYDVRFPELLANLVQQGAEIIALPAAFTQATGSAHWQILVQAAAVQQQCYVVAACQTGMHPNGRQTYGHSTIIDPWGVTLASIATDTGSITASLDLCRLQKIRAALPIHAHRRPELWSAN